MYAKVGNKKRKLWSVKTDDEIEFSKEILEDLLSGDEKVRVKLESLNLPFLKSVSGSVLYELPVIVECEPSACVCEMEIDLLYKIESSSQEDPAFLLLSKAQELLVQQNSMAMSAIEKICSQATVSFEGILKAATNTQSGIAKNISDMQQHTAGIIIANTKMIELMNSRNDQLGVKLVSLIDQVKDNKAYEASTDMWKTVFTSAMPVIIPKVGMLIETLQKDMFSNTR